MRSSTLALCLSSALVSRTEAFLLLKKNPSNSFSPDKEHSKAPEAQPEDAELSNDGDENTDEDEFAEESQLSKAGECANALAKKVCDDTAAAYGSADNVPKKDGCNKGGQCITQDNLIPGTDQKDREHWCNDAINELSKHDGPCKTFSSNNNDPLGADLDCQGNEDNKIATSSGTTIGYMCNYKGGSSRDAQWAAAECGQKIMDKFCPAAAHGSFIQKAEPQNDEPEGESEELAEDGGPQKIEDLFKSGTHYDFHGSHDDCAQIIKDTCMAAEGTSFIQNDSDKNVFTPSSRMYPRSEHDDDMYLMCGDQKYTYTRDTSSLSQLCPAKKGSSGSGS